MDRTSVYGGNMIALIDIEIAANTTQTFLPCLKGGLPKPSIDDFDAF